MTVSHNRRLQSTASLKGRERQRLAATFAVTARTEVGEEEEEEMEVSDYEEEEADNEQERKDEDRCA